MILRRVFIVASLAGMTAGGAHAIGFVRADAGASLGSFLSFPVTVQLAADESLSAPCVTAEVMQGEQRIAPSNVRIVVEAGEVPDERIVRVTTRVAIEEPVVTVIATLGCINKIERRFTVFADPPIVTLAAAPPPAEAARPVETPPPAPVPALAAASAPRPLPEAGSPIAPIATAASAPLRRVARPRPPPTAPGAAPGTAVASGARGVAPAPARATAAASAPVARLRLDALEPVAARSSVAAASAVQEASMRVAAMAASAAMAEQAASAAQANANAAAERMRAVEQALEAVRAEARRDRDQLAQMRSRLADGDSVRQWLPWLVAAMVLLAALAVWLWLKLRRAQRQQQAQWWAASQAASRQPPLNPPTLQPMTLPPQMAPTPAARPTFGAASSPPSPARQSGFGSSTLFPDSAMAQAPRDVSIEELIDLEQQAEFFVVLGQDDAAIDLLMGHIRGSGGTSPLPYLKLLEIYRRLGDRESYERTRARFNHRFNAYAPDWDADLQQGRSLEEYPSIMQRLEQCWTTPIDAMAELESLMFRRDSGELFELPAYREVLFLYSMARDLLDHTGGPPTSIDVLLPLGDNTFEATTAHPHLITMSAMSNLTDLAELGRVTEAPITVLSAAFKPSEPPAPRPGEGRVVDLDLTKPLPMDASADDVAPLSDEQRSDFLGLPPDPPRK